MYGAPQRILLMDEWVWRGKNNVVQSDTKLYNILYKYYDFGGFFYKLSRYWHLYVVSLMGRALNGSDESPAGEFYDRRMSVDSADHALNQQIVVSGKPAIFWTGEIPRMDNRNTIQIGIVK